MKEWTKEEVAKVLQKIYNKGFCGGFLTPSNFPKWSFSSTEENVCKFYVDGFDSPIVLKKGD